MTIYRIYKQMNAADTCRDPDDIHIVELCYKQSLEDSLGFVQKQILETFHKKHTEIFKRKDGTYSAHDFCSYGWEIIIQPVEVD